MKTNLMWALWRLTLRGQAVEANSLSWLVVGGDDKDHFSLSGDGVLSFQSPKNFEQPDDANKDGSYELIVEASDSSDTSTADLLIQLENMNEAPVITTLGPFGILEGYTAITTLVAQDVDAGDETFTWTVGGTDQSHFSIGLTGDLSFRSAKDFESLDDADTDGIYEITVQVSDDEGLSTEVPILVQLQNKYESIDSEAPVVTTLGPFTAQEDGVLITTLDANYSGVDMLSWSIIGGEDQDHFSLVEDTGDLSFDGRKNFDSPEDADQDNLYHVEVEISDGFYSSTVYLLVKLEGLAEAPVITNLGPFTIQEGETDVARLEATDGDGDALTWSLRGGADQDHFSLTEEGDLSLHEVKDPDNPDDSDRDGVYELTVSVSDGTYSITAEILVQFYVREEKVDPDITNIASKNNSSAGGCGAMTSAAVGLKKGPGGNPPTGWAGAIVFLGMILFPALFVQWIRRYT